MRAQDAHYWTNQYGTRSELVGGLVVGRFLDLSTSYYNPGGMAFTDQPRLMLTTSAWEFQRFSFEDIAPTDLDLSSSRLRLPPAMFALQIPLRSSKHRLAVSTVTRHSSNIEGSATRIPTAEEIAANPGTPASAIEANGTFRLNEGWLGVSWAYRVGERVGVGATAYVAGRSQFGRGQLLAQLVDGASTGFSSTSVREFNYFNVRLLSKVGLAVDLHPVALGLTITTPSVNLFGNGQVVGTEGITAIAPADSSITNELEATEQSDLASTFRSAPAIAAGASYSFGSTTAYVTVEWFGAVDEYEILNPSEFVGQTTGDTLSVDVLYELKSVVNWGVGFERRFSDWFHFYGAFFTDRSALPEGKQRDVPVSLADWDIWHVTGGGAFVIGRLDLTLGLSYGWGAEEIGKLIEIPGESPTAKLHYRSLKLILGFATAF